MDKAIDHLAKLDSGLRELEHEARLHVLALTGLLNMLEGELPHEDFVEVLARSSCALTDKIVKLREDVAQVDPKELAAA